MRTHYPAVALVVLLLASCNLIRPKPPPPVLAPTDEAKFQVIFVGDRPEADELYVCRTTVLNGEDSKLHCIEFQRFMDEYAKQNP